MANTDLEKLARIADPSARALAACRLVEDAEERVKAARAARDDAVRAMRAGGLTIPQIVEALPISMGLVKVILR